MLLPRPAPARPEPAVVRTLREYRAALDARENDALLHMAKSWLTVEQRLEGDIAALAEEMARRQAAGEVITQQMVWRAERYQQIKGKMQEEITRWNKADALTMIQREQRGYAQLGISAAKDAITASYGGSLLAPMFPVLNVDAFEAMVGYTVPGAPLNSLLKRDYPEALQGLIDALLNGTARGLGPAATAREMVRAGLSRGLDRAMLIARTELLRAYRSANIAAMRESGVVEGFYRLVKKETACLACLMRDGEIYNVQSEFSDHPAGKCIAVPRVTGANVPKWETGKQWFRSLPAERQREMMGGAKYELWQAGKFQLSDLSQMHHHDIWGSSPRVATLAELGGE